MDHRQLQEVIREGQAARPAHRKPTAARRASERAEEAALRARILELYGGMASSGSESDNGSDNGRALECSGPEVWEIWGDAREVRSGGGGEIAYSWSSVGV